MASVTSIRTGLKTAAETIAGVHGYYTVPPTILTPAAIVEPGDPVIVFDETMGRGSDDLAFSLLLLVQLTDLASAQAELDGYLAGDGATSVKAAIDAATDPGGALDGVVSMVRVASAGGYGTYQFNGAEYLGVRFEIEVTT